MQTLKYSSIPHSISVPLADNSFAGNGHNCPFSLKLGDSPKKLWVGGNNWDSVNWTKLYLFQTFYNSRDKSQYHFLQLQVSVLPSL